MATNLGKVGIVMKGTWSNSATYEVLDAVGYNGGLYIAKQDVPANTTPTNTTYWQNALDISTIAPEITITPETGVTFGSYSKAFSIANRVFFELLVSSAVTINGREWKTIGTLNTNIGAERRTEVEAGGLKWYISATGTTIRIFNQSNAEQTTPTNFPFRLIG